MESLALVARLAAFPPVLETLLGGLTEADGRWRPPEGGWSIVEVVGHLLDEEVDDFRARVASTLEDPARPWAPIDPEGSVASRRHQERDLRELLAAFARERAASVRWLRGLAAPRWEGGRVHPEAGTLRAGDLLASWAAHDARHLQQVAKRLHGLAARDGAPFSVEYAG